MIFIEYGADRVAQCRVIGRTLRKIKEERDLLISQVLTSLIFGRPMFIAVNISRPWYGKCGAGQATRAGME